MSESKHLAVDDRAQERPLSFAADMIRAVQAQRKTQTRRPIYPQPDRVTAGRFFRADGREIVCPFGTPGDRLWVRERFAISESGAVLYAADPVKGRSRLTWQKSRYLPREASRLLLRIVATHAQRLQEISPADACAEGYDAAAQTLSPIDWFARLWDRLAVAESLRWAANPWLWVVQFELLATSPITPQPVVIAPPPQRPVKVTESASRGERIATIDEKRLLAERLRKQGAAG